MIPIPQPTPTQKLPQAGLATGDTFLDVIKSSVQGVFTRGLDVLSSEYEWNKQKEMIEFQLRADRQAAEANITGSPTGAGVAAASNYGSAILAGMNPIVIGILAVAGVLLFKRK